MFGLDDILNIGKVALPFIGGLMGSEEQEDINSAQMGLARENMDKNLAFQERMWHMQNADYHATRGNQYQTAVGDMKAAGLNPMLAYMQGGAGAQRAGTPGGGSGQVPQLGNKVSAGFSAAAAATQIENVASDTAKKLAEKANVEADTRLKLEGQLPDLIQRVITGTASAAEMNARARVLDKELEAWNIRLRDLGTGMSLYQHQEIAKTEKMSYEVQKKLAEYKMSFPDLQKLVIEAKLLKLDVPERVAQAAFFSGPDSMPAMYFRHAPKSVVGAGFGSMGAVSEDVRRLFKAK